MAFIYITGAPGIGKTTIQKYLQSKGFKAHDLDDSRFGGPHSKASGERVVIPPAEQRDDDWFDRHEWKIYRTAFEELKQESKDKDIIICGVAESDREVIDLFNKVVYLNVDDDELKERLLSRTGNDYGKNSSELTEILHRKKKLDERYTDPFFSRVDASGSLESVVSHIIAKIKN